MFRTYFLAYLREDPRLTPDTFARGIALFSRVKKELPYEKDYPLLSGCLRCFTSPARYPDIVLASKGVLYSVTALDRIKAWKYNNVITANVANTALSVFLALIVSDKKYHGLDVEWFSGVCVSLAEKIEKKLRVEGEYWSVYFDLVGYVRVLRDVRNQPVFISNILRHTPELVPPLREGLPLDVKYSPVPRELEEAPEVELGKHHAQGSYGSIYVIDSSEGDKLAVKKQLMDEMIAQELTVMATCDHPNIIDLYSFKLEGRMAQIFMPYGEVLSTYTGKVLNKEDWEYAYLEGKSKAQLPKNLRRRYARDILEGLRYLHEHGILHCDIKPTNVVVVDGVAKLIDFGLSFLYTFSKFDQQPKPLEVYSLPYRPPEIVFLEDRRYTYSAEVWATGVLLLELETGVLPTIYGESNTMTNEDVLLKTTVDVIGPPFSMEPYEHFPFLEPGAAGLEAVTDIKFRELLLSMLEWIPTDRATIPDLLSKLEYD